MLAGLILVRVLTRPRKTMLKIIVNDAFSYNGNVTFMHYGLGIGLAGTLMIVFVSPILFVPIIYYLVGFVPGALNIFSTYLRHNFIFPSAVLQIEFITQRL